MIVLETERLVLREIVPADAAFILALLTDPDFLANVGDRGVRTPADAERYVAEGPRASYAAHGFGLWAVEGKAEGVPLGMCGILQRAALDTPDLGYAFVPAGRGRGYAGEAARAVVAWAGRRGIDRLAAIVSPGNARSIALLESIGFVAQRRLRLPGADHEVTLYLLAAPDAR